jgi:hypothetical protein
VPPSARGPQHFVVRARDGVAGWVNVRRGEINGDLIEVFGGLREGDVRVRRGNDEIRPSTRVNQVMASRQADPLRIEAGAAQI